MTRVALLAPMRTELRPLLRPLSLRRVGSGADPLFVGSLGKIEVVATIAGIGTRRAARATARLLLAASVDHLIVVGVAGGIGSSVEIGDLVVPERVVDLASGAVHEPVFLGGAIPRGVLASGDALVADPGAAAALGARGVIAVDMETAAVAGVCEQRRCPWSVFRGISDRADDGTTDAAILGLAAADGGINVAALLRFLATQPWRAPQLVRLARGLSLGRHAAADAAIREIAQVASSPTRSPAG